jgi:outer membrane beta-barrel protein
LLFAVLPRVGWAAEYEAVDEEDLAKRAGTGPPRKTLAERIPAVSGRVFGKQGRVELSPAVGMSLNDPFFNQVIGSVGLSYHVFEQLWFGASADFYGSFETTVPVTGGGSIDPPAYNHPVYAARLEVGWAPIYGKLSLFAESVFHFDTYLALGAGILGPSESDATLEGSVALGQHFFLSEWIALRLELRDQMFMLARAPSKDKEKKLQNLLTVSVGVCLYFPTTFEREAL